MVNEWAPKLLARLQKIPQLKEVNSDQQFRGLQTNVVIDRDAASRLGILPQAVDSTLNSAFGQRQVGVIYAPQNQYRVILEVDPGFQKDPNSLDKIYVTSSKGFQVPLSQIAHIETSNTALSVNHQSQFPSVTISYNLAPGVSLGEAQKLVAKAAQEIGMPSRIRASFQGTAQVFSSSLDSPADPFPDRDHRRLHRAGGALRELHSSADHPLDHSIGRTRRAAGPDAVRHGALDRLLHRHHSADRHREEECHHDDRFRARGGAAGGSHAGRGHLPGMPGAIPADHDDDDGGAVRRRSAGRRTWRGRGTAQAPRRRDRGRTDRLADADALHHAGHLSHVRAPAALVAAPARAWPRSASRCSRADEVWARRAAGGWGSVGGLALSASKWRPTLGQVFVASLLGLALVLALLFALVFRGLQATIIESSERTRDQASREISERVTNFLNLAPATVREFQTAVSQGVFDPRDPAALQTALFTILVSSPSVSELTLTYGVGNGLRRGGPDHSCGSGPRPVDRRAHRAGDARWPGASRQPACEPAGRRVHGRCSRHSVPGARCPACRRRARWRIRRCIRLS